MSGDIHEVQESAELALGELVGVSTGLDWDRWEELPGLITDARAIFAIGAGRSGLATRMAAMRLMQLRLRVHVAGESRTPAIRSGDLLLAVSGSGTTPGVLREAEVATQHGAGVAAITADASSPLASLASHLLLVPGAVKTDRSGEASGQYARTLFEQLTVVLLDAVFHVLWKRSSQAADAMHARQANLVSASNRPNR